MKKESNAGKFLVILLGILGVGIVIGGAVLVYALVNKEANDVSERTAGMLNAWNNGAVTQGIAVKVSDQTSMFDRIRGKKLYGVEWHYTVDSQEYTSPEAYRFDGEIFDELDPDGDGQGPVEVHYDPQDPQISAIRGLIRGDRKLLIE